MKKLVIVIFFLCGSLCIFAQDTAQFKGEVLNKETELPIANVVVLIDSVQVGMLTDSLGKYWLPYVPPGIYDVTFRANGYRDLTVFLVDFRSGQITFYLAKMTPLTMYDFPKEFWNKKRKK